MTDYMVYDHLISGDSDLIRQPIILAEGEGALLRGALLGLIFKTIGSPAHGTNTGDGVCNNQALGANAQLGTYELVAVSATDFAVYAPNGSRLADATVGTTYEGEIVFKINASTDGHAFVAGDSFTITVSRPVDSSGNLIERYRWVHQSNLDGSAEACCLLADDTDSTSADANGPAYFHGQFDPTAILLQTGETIALYDTGGRIKDLFLRSIVPYNPPT
jgi:hypothetical protein